MTVENPKIILASSSPRRADILASIGLTFEIATAHILERPHPEEAPADYIMRLARAKVMAVARQVQSGLLIGADTIVVLDGRIIEKPEDEEDAGRILRLLAGRWHAVMTGVSIYDAESRSEVADYDKTLVRFAQLSDREIAWYIRTGEPMGKAGAYAIQGRGAIFVNEIAGNYHNVVGLPIPLVYRLAKQLGYSFIT